MGYLEVSQIDNGVCLEGVTNFNLKDTFECGQCFRWYPKGGGYISVLNDKVVEIYYENSNLIIKGITVDDYIDYFENYFDFDTDYDDILKILSKEPVFNSIVGNNSGIRILKQDLFEVIISFIISANNNIPRIKTCISNLSSLYGSQFVDEGVEYYAFPTLEQLSKATELELKSCGLGYRVPYIMQTIKMIYAIDKKYGAWEEYFREMDYKKAHYELMNFAGVGDKVSECICLFGLSLTEAFPIDTWIKKILFRYYGVQTQSVERTADFIESRFGKLAGYAQQYLFYYKKGKV